MGFKKVKFTGQTVSPKNLNWRNMHSLPGDPCPSCWADCPGLLLRASFWPSNEKAVAVMCPGPWSKGWPCQQVARFPWHTVELGCKVYKILCGRKRRLRWGEDNRKNRPGKLGAALASSCSCSCIWRQEYYYSLFTLTPIALQPSKMIS